MEGTDDSGPPPPEGSLSLYIHVHSIRGCTQEESLRVSYEFDALDWSGNSFAGEIESIPVAGGGQDIQNFVKVHVLPVGLEDREKIFLKFVTEPIIFQVEGLHTAQGSFKLALQDLIFSPKFDAYTDRPFPGPFVTGWYKVVPSDPEQAEGFPENVEINVTAELSDQICSDEELSEANVITISVRELHNLPSTWKLPLDSEGGEDATYSYVVKYSLPGTVDIKTVEASPGLMIPALSQNAQQDGDEQKVEVPNVEIKSYNLQHTGSVVTNLMEEKQQKLRWDHVFKTFSMPDSTRMLKEAIRKNILFAIELKRVLKEGGDYVYAKKYHGLAEFDLSEFRTEDTTSIIMRCPVGPHSDYSTPSNEELELCPPPEGAAEPEELLHNGQAANPYLLAETYIIVQIEALRALFPKPPAPPAPLPNVRDIIPPRLAVKKYYPDLEGTKQFNTFVQEICGEIQGEYSALFGDKDATTQQEPDDKLKQLVRQLIVNGKYHDFKVKIKSAVLKIVKESAAQADFAGEETKNQVLKLFASLKEDVNAFINPDSAAAKSQSHIPEAAVVSKVRQELELAFEAECHLNYSKAIQHLDNRLVYTPADPSNWYDLGTTTMRSGDIAKAEQCFKEALKLDSKHVPSLLASGILLFVRDRYAEAESCFKSLGEDPKNQNDVLMWACCAVFYDLDSKRREASSCLKSMAAAEKKAKESRRSPFLRAANFAVELHATKFVESAMAMEIQRNGDSEELRIILGRCYLNNRQYDRSREELTQAIKGSSTLPPQKVVSPIAMSLMGHTHFLENGWATHTCEHSLTKDLLTKMSKEAISWYERVQSGSYTGKSPPDIQQYLRLAKMYTGIGHWEDARKVFEKACKMNQPFCTSFLGLAIAVFHLGCEKLKTKAHSDALAFFQQAELALQEAAILDIHNAEVHGMNAVVCLAQARAEHKDFHSSKVEEAKKALGRALQEGISTKEIFPAHAFILQQIAVYFKETGENGYQYSIAALRRALETSVPQASEDGTTTPAILTLSKMFAEICELSKDLGAALAAHKQLLKLLTVKSEIEISLKRIIGLLQALHKEAKELGQESRAHAYLLEAKEHQRLLVQEHGHAPSGGAGTGPTRTLSHAPNNPSQRKENKVKLAAGT